MKQNYNDIRSRITEPVRWYDEVGCPRYCDFLPERVNNIYAEEVALLEIACQNCDQRFIVAVSTDSYDRVLRKQTLSQMQEICYGDPPNIECCPAGPTMSSDTTQIIGLWSRLDATLGWERIR